MIDSSLDSLLGMLDAFNSQRGLPAAYYKPPAEVACAYLVFMGVALLYLAYRASKSGVEAKVNSIEPRRPAGRK